MGVGEVYADLGSVLVVSACEAMTGAIGESSK